MSREIAIAAAAALAAAALTAAALGRRSRQQRRMVDLSHTIESPMPSIFAESAQPKISPYFTHADAAQSGNYEGCTCELTRTDLCGSTSTYLDAPYHFHPSLPALEALPLSKLVLPGVVVDCTRAVAGAGGACELPASVLDGCDVAGKAVLLRTDWSRHWGSDAYKQHPFVGRELARALVARGAQLVAIDTLVIDTFQDPTRPAHVTLLGAEVPIVENGAHFGDIDFPFLFVANALKIKGGPSFPVRAFALEC